MRALIDALPVALENIDLVRIETFIRLYAAIAAGEAGTRRAGVSAAMKQVLGGIKQVRKFSDQTAFPGIDGLVASNVVSWSKPPYSRTAVPLVDSLMAVVQGTDLVIHDLGEHARTNHQRALFSEDQQSAIEQQEDVAQDNVDNLQNARSHLVQVPPSR